MKIFEEEKPEKEKKITGRLGLTNVIGKKRKLEDCMKQDRNDERIVRNRRLIRQEEVEQPSSGRKDLCGSDFISKRKIWSNKVNFGGAKSLTGVNEFDLEIGLVTKEICEQKPEEHLNQNLVRIRKKLTTSVCQDQLRDKTF